MSDDTPPAGFLVAAQIRTAAREGIPIIVRHRGHEISGTIVLKINRLDGSAHVLTQVRMGDEMVWSPLARKDPMPESDAERAIDRQVQIDPDCWSLEIEDRLGRHWFPGRVVKF